MERLDGLPDGLPDVAPPDAPFSEAGVLRRAARDVPQDVRHRHDAADADGRPVADDASAAAEEEEGTTCPR